MRRSDVPGAARHFLAGLRAALPVVAGYLPIAVSFGLVARDAGFSPAMAALMSAVVYAGASQFAAAAMVAAGTMVPEIVLATFFMNLRHLVMTASLMRKVSVPSRTQRLGIAALLTDETFAVASFSREAALARAPGLAGLMLAAWTTWWAGTILGARMADLIPPALAEAMGVMLYGLFIGLLVPAVRGAPIGLAVAVTAMASHTALRLVLAPGWAMVAAIILGAALAPLLARGRKAGAAS